MAETKDGGGGSPGCVQEAQQSAAMNRKDRRKTAKKEKRKQKRKELAAKKREEEEVLLNDPEEQRRIQLEEERENERLEKERKEFEDREKMFLEALAAKRKTEEEEEERRKALEEESKQNKEYENDDDEWEYIEEGPPEIIWQGNEIIVRKKKVKVKRKDVDIHIRKEDSNRPTSNPLPPQSEAFADCTNGSVVSAQQLLENAAQQIPNFGTEQDKAHCPFHLKTGTCRFGSRCSRVHFYPDKSCTLLIKNMYNGPGLAWEQDEGLEHTDEEVERCYEEFYEDVHTEFLKFGEIVNFKVCKNSSFHLRGNVYVHYKSLDSALLACQSINGRYFAGKKVQCEFVAVTKWKVAICGEYMKSRLKTCSRGTACNFIHCFHNPGGDYEWADWDKPPPKYWVKKMAALFGYSEECGYDNQMEQEGRNSSKMVTADPDRFHRRSRSRERDSSRNHYEEYDIWRSRHRERHAHGSRKTINVLDEKNCEAGMISKHTRRRKNRRGDSDSDCDVGWSNKDRGGDRRYNDTRKNSINQIEVLESEDCHTDNLHGSDSDGHRLYVERHTDGHHHRKRESSSHWKMLYGVPDDYESKDITHGTVSTVYSSDNDRDRDANHGRRKEPSKHQKKVPRSPDDSRDEGDRNRRKESSKYQKKVQRSPDNSRDDRDRNRDSGSRVEDRDRHRKHKRKRSRHSNEEFEFIDDRGNSMNKLEDKYYNKESDSERVEPKRVKKKHQSTREIKPNDTDSRYYYSENLDKVRRHPKSGDKFSVKHRNSYRDDSSDERDSSDSVCQSIQRSESQNSGYHSDEDINERGRWGSNKTGPEKHRRSSAGSVDFGS